VDFVVHWRASAGVDWHVYGCNQDEDVACSLRGAIANPLCAELRGAIVNPYGAELFGETKEPGWSAASLHDDRWTVCPSETRLQRIVDHEPY
jgi:hypothetical protein